ncbi:hypothetical protein [Streptomyces sp. NPDC096105]|uniref:hypothetical protein n=1 Tax=Streptomyces sp. NPDC096105 TaxID=3366074 RepID=UPI003802F544
MTSSAPSPDGLPVYDSLVRERGDVVAEVREVAERTQLEVRQALAGTVRPRQPQAGLRQQQGPGGPRHPQGGPRQPQGGTRQPQESGLPQGRGQGHGQPQGGAPQGPGPRRQESDLRQESGPRQDDAPQQQEERRPDAG